MVSSNNIEPLKWLYGLNVGLLQIFLSHLVFFANNGCEFPQHFSFSIYFFCNYELKKRKVSEPEPTFAALKWYLIEFKTSNSSAQRVARPR